MGVQSTLRNPTYAFTTAGVHTVTLVATNAVGVGSTYSFQFTVNFAAGTVNARVLYWLGLDSVKTFFDAETASYGDNTALAASAFPKSGSAAGRAMQAIQFRQTYPPVKYYIANGSAVASVSPSLGALVGYAQAYDPSTSEYVIIAAAASSTPYNTAEVRVSATSGATTSATPITSNAPIANFLPLFPTYFNGAWYGFTGQDGLYVQTWAKRDVSAPNWVRSSRSMDASFASQVGSKVFNGALFLLTSKNSIAEGGAGTGAGQIMVSKTTDGTTWVDYCNINIGYSVSASRNMLSVIGNTLCFYFRRSGSSNLSVLQSDATGTAWTESVCQFAGAPLVSGGGVALDGGGGIMVAQYLNPGNRILISTDGINFTALSESAAFGLVGFSRSQPLVTIVSSDMTRWLVMAEGAYSPQ